MPETAMQQTEPEAINPFLDQTLRMVRNVDERVVLLEPREEMCSSTDGYLHFSIPLTVAEEAAWQSLEEDHAVPGQMSSNHVRPAHVGAGELIGKGEVIKKGKQMLIARGEVFQRGKLIATVTVCFCRFVKEQRPAPA